MKATELAGMCYNYALHSCSGSFSQVFKDGYQKIADDCWERIIASAGKYEVDEDTQAFELSTVGTMAIGLREELLDVVNYCAMIQHLTERGDPTYTEKLMGIYCNTIARDAVSSLLLIQGRLDSMIRKGEFTPNPGKTYVDQLSVDTGVDHA